MADDLARISHEVRVAKATRWPAGDSWIRGYAEDCALLLARLSAAEQKVQERVDAVVLVAVEAQNACSAAEARAEAAEAGFKAYDDSDGAMPSDVQWAAIVAARAALAGREETGGGG